MYAPRTFYYWYALSDCRIKMIAASRGTFLAMAQILAGLAGDFGMFRSLVWF